MNAAGPAVRRRPPRAVGEEAKSARRAEILAAAKAVFAAKGYHGTTMADVARAAGLSYGSVYWYFDAKDRLFHALMDDEAEALRSHITDVVAEAGESDPEQVLRMAVRATFEFFERDRDSVTLLFRDALTFGSGFERHLHRVYEGFVDDLAGLITEGQRRGLVADLPSHVAAFSIAALVGQLALRRLVTDDGLPASAIADFVVALVFDGLRPR
jgi:AcrR family transcriptional regulator